ncbi:MAG: biopolymer transporter ExbD [Firmicutes bacterium]|nr:biopolymer transporter ExbD [Bacillota bacterium]
MMFSRKPKTPRLDIVPMIDVLFFVLVFFMYFTTFKTAVSGVPLNLPSSSRAVSLEQNRIVVTIDQKETVYYGAEPVSLDQLTRTLAPLASKDPNLLVIINADAQVSYGKVISVMDAVTDAGVSQPAFGVERKNKR